MNKLSPPFYKKSDEKPAFEKYKRLNCFIYWMRIGLELCGYRTDTQNI